MKIGFNAWTDEAREKLEELGVRFRRESPTTITIYTEDFDLRLEEELDRGIQDNSSEQRGSYRSQGLRILKHQDGSYYYLIKGHVFHKWDKVSTDNSTTPATRFVTAVLDLVDEDLQDRWRDYFSNTPPMAETGHWV